ncbi:GNAT family N-acetyltransferase [Guptibacillus hwajinpoensis]|uniref:Ribosomal protein S18 acetylase RimI-like enzyme n=1 Tax=Guptibacillus hwajinpoensis TaxID=208199 RepID=A0ABU0K2Y7_9BACL|nr:GNAT family N-acetyltransferase [Alkalihalobacillus hemicentroti]MDQ0483722.1 ribosomal protein S18 acetylase RimI-like enzyme [Alkalihalobacillus hemicentroti]
MEFKLHNVFRESDSAGIRDVYHSVGWTKHTCENIKTIYQASSVVVIVTYGEQVVGVGRALSDGVFNAAIYDVVVHQDFQNRGMAKKIMMFLLEELSDISCIHLISTTMNEAFYEKVGFKKVKTGMARYLSSSLNDEYLES